MHTPYLETNPVIRTSERRTRFAAGDRIGDRFVVRHCISGGMGEVYLGYDLKWNRPMALKTFRSELAKDPYVHSRFRKEVTRWLMMRKHPHVVQCHGLEIIDALPFIAMEWVVGEAGQGVTLRDRLQRGPLPLGDALQFATDLCRGLSYGQQVSPGFVHRDIKPENVLVTGNRIAKLTDFGLASLKQDLLGTPARPLSMIDLDMADRRAERLRAKGNTNSMPGLWTVGVSIIDGREFDIDWNVGTPGYRSPEQVANRELDQRSDLFSLACMLYEMLGGRTPQDAIGTEHVPEEQRSAADAFLPRIVPQSVRDLLWECLDERLGNRPATVDIVLDRLCALYESELGSTSRIVDAASEDIYEAGSRAICLTQLNVLDQALAEGRRALTLQPHNASLHSLCGAILNRMGRNEESLVELSEAIALDPAFVGAYVNRGITYAHMGRLDEALRDFDSAIALRPSLAEGYLNRAGIHDSQGREQAALADLDRGIALSPRSEQAYFLRGSIHFRRQRYEEALRDFDKTIELNLAWIDGFIGRGAVFHAQGNRARAMEEFDRAIEIDPNAAIAYRNIASLLREDGNVERAIWYVERAAELGDVEAQRFAPAAHLELANRFRSNGQLDKALAEYTKVLEAEPDEAAAWFNRALVHRDLGSLEEALSDYSEGLRREPANGRAYRERADIYNRLGRPAEAAADLRHATEHDPEDGLSLVNRANAQARAGRTEEALADFERALAIDPELGPALCNKGVVHIQRGELRQAHELFVRAAELGDVDGARYARMSAKDMGIDVPPPPHYQSEVAQHLFLNATSADDLRAATRRCPQLASRAFLWSVEGMMADLTDPEQRAAVRTRLSVLYEVARNR